MIGRYRNSSLHIESNDLFQCCNMVGGLRRTWYCIFDIHYLTDVQGRAMTGVCEFVDSAGSFRCVKQSNESGIEFCIVPSLHGSHRLLRYRFKSSVLLSVVGRPQDTPPLELCLLCLRGFLDLVATTRPTCR